MKLFFLLFIFPIAMAVDLFRLAIGKQTMDEEWHEVHVDGNLNHGQGKEF